MSKIDLIKDAQLQKWAICVYGLGYLGRRLLLEIPSLFGLIPNYYCDGDDKKVDSIKLAGAQPIYKNEILQMKEHCLVFILVDDPYDIEIQNMLSNNTFLYTITLRELVQLDDVIKLFYGNQFYKKYISLSDYSKK